VDRALAKVVAQADSIAPIEHALEVGAELLGRLRPELEQALAGGAHGIGAEIAL
jgi:hypothetical protein